MSWCGDKKIDAAQIAQASGRLREVFVELKKDQILPPSATLEITSGYPGVAGISKSTASILADPEVFACFTKQESKAIMLHEAGHHHDRSLSDLAVSLGLLGQVGLVVAAVPVCLFSAGALYRRYKWGKYRSDLTSWATALGVVFAAHTLVGRGVAEIRKQEEYRADAFAARVMRDPQPMISAFNTMYTFRRDHIGSSSDAYEKDKEKNRRAEEGRVTLFFGVWGRHHTHPDTNKRIAKLEAMKQP